MDNLTETNLDNSLMTAHYMPRPRIDSIFDQVTRCKLVYVIAGAGYGKTQAVQHYIKQQPDAIVRWMQLTESDNIGSRYWESLVHSVYMDNPDLAMKLRELGFPETLAAFKRFTEIQKSYEHRSHKTFLVLDDFHLINSKQALTFAERCAYLHIPGACVIIISRKEPEINAVSLFSRGEAGLITEDELRFTESEIADFMRQYGIQFSAREVPQFAEATKGWALAIRLLSLVLRRTPRNMTHALETMKQNIFKLFEIEAFNDFDEDIKKSMVRFSLVSDLPLSSFHDISGDESFIQNSPQMASFLWYDSFAGDYRVHPLYLEFLQSKRHILDDEEILETYRNAAQWCFENNFFMDAMNYCAKSNQFPRMLELFLSHPFKLPHDSCEYFLDILERIDPENKEKNDHSILLLKIFIIPILLMGAGRYDEARERSYEAIEEWEHSDIPFAINILFTAYSNLAYIDTYTCTVTHKYESAEHLRKSIEYFNKSSIPPLEITGDFGVADIRSFACLVGEGADVSEIDSFLENAKKMALFIAKTTHHMYYGYEDLVACEIAFFRNQPETARNHAHQAILKAHEEGQNSIALMAVGYLIRIAVQEGESSLVKELLKQIRGYLDKPSFWNRQLLYDLSTGFFYANIGLPKQVPLWLTTDERDTTTEVRIPVRELIVGVKCHLAAKNYSQALAVLCSHYPRSPQERFVFGELTLSLLLAVARFRTGDISGAVEDFEKAYRLSYDGELEMPFVELGRNLHPLAAAALRRPECSIPNEWLKLIDLKASIYAKKALVVMNSLKEEQKEQDTIQISEREYEVLSDLYHGLSREEIAVNRYLSINTVKKILQSIYIKLNANSNVDAIRIAIEKNLVQWQT